MNLCLGQQMFALAPAPQGRGKWKEC